jgi:hypothetical protein
LIPLAGYLYIFVYPTIWWISRNVKAKVAASTAG